MQSRSSHHYIYSSCFALIHLEELKKTARIPDSVNILLSSSDHEPDGLPQS